MIVGLGRRRYRKCLPNLGIKPGGGGRRHAQAGRKPHREMLDPFQCPHPLSYLEACSAKSGMHLKRCNVRRIRSRKLSPPSLKLKRHSTGEHAQDRAAAPIVASYPYYYIRAEHSVLAVDTFFLGCLKCGGTVPAQAACLLFGTPNFPSQALGKTLRRFTGS